MASQEIHELPASPKTSSNGPIDIKKEDISTSLKKDVLGRDPSYFHYYSLLTHQQNMLQDTIRTSTYQSAILKNPDLYQDKLVMDVGAGSGILSFFAVQAGAKVIAVEASNMALKLQKLLDAAAVSEGEKCNPWLKDRITVINKRIEDIELSEKVDTIISEPIGVLLVHERMLESFILARDRFLKPGGAMVPSQGNILLAPFTDSLLWSETMTKVRFWEQKAFYGVDLSPLREDAIDEMFGMPVVGYFDANSLMAPAGLGHLVDFTSISLEALQNFTVSFEWRAAYTGIMHGIATWFDIYFIAPTSCERRLDVTMSTGPHSERTHWQQTRLLFKEPLAVNSGQTIKGTIKFSVNPMRSYNMNGSVELLGPDGTVAKRDCVWALQEQTYNYSYNGPMGGDFRPELLGLYENLGVPNTAPNSFPEDMA